MIVVLDGDTNGAACGRLRDMGNFVLEPPTCGGACLLAAWYLIVARRAARGDGLFAGVVFVRGGPLTARSSAAPRGPRAAAHAHLRGLLAAEFRAGAFVLFDGGPDPAENSRLWSVYRGLCARGERVFVI